MFGRACTGWEAQLVYSVALSIRLYPGLRLQGMLCCAAVLCCPAVLYPKAPLLDATTGRLTTPCVKALLRIFLMCDIDGVRGWLSAIACCCSSAFKLSVRLWPALRLMADSSWPRRY